jgi:catalase
MHERPDDVSVPSSSHEVLRPLIGRSLACAVLKAVLHPQRVFQAEACMTTSKTPPTSIHTDAGDGGETHQSTQDEGQRLTTNRGVPVSDNQNSLSAGVRGPTLLEDFVLREKISHFDHERIPERVVHARGSGAHGYFQPYKAWGSLTRAAFLQDANKRTPVFVRFSNVAGGAGSVDLPRDVRGFAIKFYTEEGNFDLVGNNIPVFFIQDAMKFPDLVHAVKMEPDRAFPQASSAHDTFWDFVSMMPESMHMLLWQMSDRTIPRSLRMIEGFGVHTFRFVNAAGTSTFVKFHLRPSLGAQAVLWDEAVKINGADNDFHRRDLWEAIEGGDFPAWEFSVQAFDEEVAASLPFDVLDPTKIIPEEVVPLTPLGRLVLDRNPDNFFAETEQVAFHPGNVVPGIDFTNDPLLQGRLFSYLDTQLIRLGGPNFHQLPVNQAKGVASGCPFHVNNYQRDGHMQMDVPRGRVAYEPNTLDPSGPREAPTLGFVSHEDSHSSESADRLRRRPESFADHYSQARMFFRSMGESERQHIIGAFAFEFGKLEHSAIRDRMLGHLAVIDHKLVAGVERALGVSGTRSSTTPFVAPIDLPESPSLSLVKKWVPSLEGRKVGVLVGEGFSARAVEAIIAGVDAEGGIVEVIAPKKGGAVDDIGTLHMAHHALAAAPSVLFDAVAVLASPDGALALARDPDAMDFLRDAHRHLKAIGLSGDAETLLRATGLAFDASVVHLDGDGGVAFFVVRAKAGKYWPRERARSDSPSTGGSTPPGVVDTPGTMNAFDVSWGVK